MISTLIIDDEELARSRVRRMLAGFSDVSLIGEASNGSEAVLAIESQKPDLVLLDVQMPDFSGFDVLRMLDTPELPLVVFVTAFDEYALDAFEVSALDYLLKPVRRVRLERAIARARERLASDDGITDKLKRLLEITAPRAHGTLDRIPARKDGRILIFLTSQIAALRVDLGLVYIDTSEGEMWTKYTSLAQIEGQLDPAKFLRVHRQHIVNLDHITEVVALDNATARLRLRNGSMVPVSRSGLRDLKKVLDL